MSGRAIDTFQGVQRSGSGALNVVKPSRFRCWGARCAFSSFSPLFVRFLPRFALVSSHLTASFRCLSSGFLSNPVTQLLFSPLKAFHRPSTSSLSLRLASASNFRRLPSILSSFDSLRVCITALCSRRSPRRNASRRVLFFQPFLPPSRQPRFEAPCLRSIVLSLFFLSLRRSTDANTGTRTIRRTLFATRMSTKRDSLPTRPSPLPSTLKKRYPLLFRLQTHRSAIPTSSWRDGS